MEKDGTVGGPLDGMLSTMKRNIISTVNKEHNPYVPTIGLRSFSNANVISSNYNQGILLVEGSSAIIQANKIDKNIKANIALGGRNCG